MNPYPRRVLFEVHGSSCAGMGHVSRSITLATHLADAWGIEPVFYTNPDPVIREWLAQSGFAVAAGTPKSEVWVVDLPIPDTADKQLVELRRSAQLLVALDYDPAGPSRPDLVVSLMAHGPQRGFGPETRHVVGLDYALIRPDVRAKREARLFNILAMKSLLLVLGGTDAAGRTHEVLDAVACSSRYLPTAMDVVLGPGFDGPRPDDSSGPIRHVNVHDSPADLSELMAKAESAICNGGTTMLELLHLGVPCLVLPATAAEARFARSVGDRGAAVVLRETLSQADLKQAVGRWLEQPQAERIRMSQAARRIVDGYGVARIATLMQDCWNSVSLRSNA